MAKKSKKPIKRYALALLTALWLYPVGWAYAACFGFSEQEMPAPIAEYICQYASVGSQVIGIQEATNGPIWFIQLSGPDGELLANVQHVLDANGALGDIIYFQLPNGAVLLDRRGG